jgi:hypothetical protein
MDWRNKEWYDLIQRFANAQNLMAKDDSHQAETFRGSSEAESFIGSTTSATIKRIREGVARLTKRDKR